ncbi:MFS transporter [Plantactinospora soyae]|uniref:MFS family permease n=1 Tax=Plantactinospora soyae TaxID=1544732 RepID=A0A927M3K3_9ACTN|nr:MFS transporter [Plantactinospora soyae]MBE1486161.1 MFS family permease [Plantactinospora soyae]
MTDTTIPSTPDATDRRTIPADGTDGRPGVAGLGGAFARLWTAAVVSRLGDTLRTPALALLAASVTRDPRAIAAVVVAGQLPPLLFGLLGGVYADRWDRRRTMAGSDALRAVLVGGFALLVATSEVHVGVLAGCAFLLATLGTFFDAAAFAVLPALVPADRLAVANGRLQAGTAMAGGLVGAPLAGVLFAVGAALPFAVDAVTFAVAALLALTLRPIVASSRPPGPTVHRRVAWRAAGDGLRWIWRDRTLRQITLLAMVTNLATSGLIAIIVLYALDVLKVPATGYGLFMSAAVFGALGGGLLAGRIATRLGTLPGLRSVLGAETLAIATLAVARHPVPGAIALAVFSAGTASWNALSSTYGQRNVPVEMLGRVGSAQRTVALLAAPVGAIGAGVLGSAAGLSSVLYAATAVFALVTVVSWPMLHRGVEVESGRP